MENTWPFGFAFQRLRNYLSQKRNPSSGIENKEVDITIATLFMFVVIIMCATSWGPLIKGKPLSLRRANNQDGPPQPPPATN